MNLKVCFKPAKSTVDTRDMLRKVYGGITAMNANSCKGVKTYLLARVRRIGPEYAASGSSYPLHDDSPQHSILIVKQFLASREIVYAPLICRTHLILFQ
ncbi:hypothetical protein NPIL_59431 [Nephila pilipes]|uniref:Uncharacterized protein n=1 Tax=Nephila pilipes TaxID=299642 RepID=A0A8X6PV96_NEPPI|nr:hypothetical protein NPIL_59431 [Nephila pilipes]